jgi:hypothetical protein
LQDINFPDQVRDFCEKYYIDINVDINTFINACANYRNIVELQFQSAIYNLDTEETTNTEFAITMTMQNGHTDYFKLYKYYDDDTSGELNFDSPYKLEGDITLEEIFANALPLFINLQSLTINTELYTCYKLAPRSLEVFNIGEWNTSLPLSFIKTINKLECDKLILSDDFIEYLQGDILDFSEIICSYITCSWDNVKRFCDLVFYQYLRNSDDELPGVTMYEQIPAEYQMARGKIHGFFGLRNVPGRLDSVSDQQLQFILQTEFSEDEQKEIYDLLRMTSSSFSNLATAIVGYYLTINGRKNMLFKSAYKV